jgi:hypothetical protein
MGKSWVGWIGALLTKKQAANYIIDAMNAYLQKADLV